jgi:DNA ligase-1
MNRFARLFAELDASTATGDKVAALRATSPQAPAADAAWAVYFLAGGKPRQVVPTALLRAPPAPQAGIDDWLFEECYQAVGDLAETIAHVLPPPARAGDDGLAHWVEQRLLPCAACRPRAGRPAAPGLDELDAPALPAGQADRRRLSRRRQQAAGAARAGRACGARRQAGGAAHDGLDRRPRQPNSAARFRAAGAGGDDDGRRDPASPTPSSWRTRCRPPRHAGLGPAATGWWNGSTTASARSWCGGGQVWIWSRGEELVTERFPEIVAARRRCPTAPCSTARCWSGPRATRGRRRSTCCSSASAARR